MAVAMRCDVISFVSCGMLVGQSMDLIKGLGLVFVLESRVYEYDQYIHDL